MDYATALICIRHQEWHLFTSPVSHQPDRRLGNAYYHANPACVRAHWPYFAPCSVKVSDDVRQQLQEPHSIVSGKRERTSPCDTIISYTHTITHAYNTLNTVYSIPSPLERALLSIKLDIIIKVLDQKKKS